MCEVREECRVKIDKEVKTKKARGEIIGEGGCRNQQGPRPAFQKVSVARPEHPQHEDTGSFKITSAVRAQLQGAYLDLFGGAGAASVKR